MTKKDNCHQNDKSISWDDVAILIPSCDIYSDLWEPFFCCFEKYWTDCPCVIYLGTNHLSYSKPNLSVVNITIGDDIDYSTNLLVMLRMIEQKFVILWVDDRLLTDHVQSSYLLELINFFELNNLAYLKLISGSPYGEATNFCQPIGDLPKDSKYRACITVGLWRKDILVSLLCKGETAWEFEINGSMRSKSIEDRFCAFTYKSRNHSPIKDKHLLMKGKLIRNSISYLRKNHLENYLQNRKKQSIISFIYLLAYHFVKDCTNFLRNFWIK